MERSCPVGIFLIFYFRALFGRPDQAEVDKFLDENLGQIRREKAAEIKQKLGFDVITEKPISNR